MYIFIFAYIYLYIYIYIYTNINRTSLELSQTYMIQYFSKGFIKNVWQRPNYVSVN